WGSHLQLYRNTIAFQAYAPRIRVPLLWLSSTNDFHGLMDDTYRTSALIPHQQIRYSLAPHLNHRFTPPFQITRALWIDQHLKSGPPLAGTPVTKLHLDADRDPSFTVRPDRSQAVDKVAIYYSIDPDPKARFWRSAAAIEEESGWRANLAIMDLGQPLFAFANVHYRLGKTQSLHRGEVTSTYALSSQLHTAPPDELKASRVTATDRRSTLIDDFKHAWRDWYVLNADNREHWQYWTRKITDPKWRGRPDAVLSLEMDLEKDNRILVIAVENEWRGYRGPRRSYLAVVPVKAGKGRVVRLRMSDLREMKTGEELKTWLQLDVLGLAGRWTAKKGERAVDNRWAGPVPRLRRLEWVTHP
ncbi:MAG: hypothetical protein OER86_06765, partial [Phycisphaerae bacterium]|nr:hypothetical protein [Phycisphaerae bacterium]